MGPIEAIKTCLAKSFQFSGRASRAEFWWFWVASSILIALPSQDTQHAIWASPRLWISLLAMLPSLAVGVRRMQDSGQAGLLFLIGAGGVVLLSIPALNLARDNPVDASAMQWICFALQWAISFYLFWHLIAPSQPGPNRFGPNPLEATP